MSVMSVAETKSSKAATLCAPFTVWPRDVCHCHFQDEGDRLLVSSTGPKVSSRCVTRCSMSLVEAINHKQQLATMVLSQEEIDGCREAFLAFDKDRSGSIDVWELRQVLEAMGQKPTEEELFQMISEVTLRVTSSHGLG